MTRLSALLAAAAIKAPPSSSDPEITVVSDDSRTAQPGALFVAVRGFHVDGHDYVRDAIGRGAAAVVVEHGVDTGGASAMQIVVADSRRALSALAAALHGDPSRDLWVAGVTGTDGKTTTCTLLWGAWRAAGVPAASLTTVDWRCGDEVTPNKSRQTTLDAHALHAHLRAIRDAGCTHVALETSSHGLALHRVDDVRYRCAVYTRVTSEHLDVHGSREAYLAAKARLAWMVSERRDGVAVLDAADPFAFPVLSAIPVDTTITYSADPSVPADVRAGDIRQRVEGTGFTLTTPWGGAEVELALNGRFNVANACAALAAACAGGVALETAVKGVGSVHAVPGRMERVDAGQPFTVVVDYAHTAESLETVLLELRQVTRGRLWVVFGSAGERDVEKRAVMGAVAAARADLSVITDEDPRGEDRLRILEEIAAGATGAGAARGETVVVIPDRRQAIAYAIDHAADGDTVLLAGKGHEASIIGASGPEPWDERAEAEAALRRRRAAS